jgi:ectoine hydroxylase-related dioxygenase (phytanoyl-CoA dioxygenase family)
MNACTTASPWLRASDCRVADLAALVALRTLPADCPSAAEIVRNVPVYDCAALRPQLAAPGRARALMAEWLQVFEHGPGIVALRGAFADGAVVDRVSAQFREMIEDERAKGANVDHFGGAGGSNDRVWNALQKLCERAPALFAEYYANDMLALACEAWLGPAYQMTSQVNCVNPGGPAQSAHRDYHLGVLAVAQAAAYPAHVHRLSAALTLQGAVAHVDMPLESGPTLYLPHSQKYSHGYLVHDRPEFQAFFDAQHVQLPLAKGDAVFFNPALLHAAGHNRTAGVHRLANLLQVSSTFGRPMETVGRAGLARALYPVLQARLAAGETDRAAAARVIAASLDGYGFPNNLDRDPPRATLAPESQQALALRALDEGWSSARFDAALTEQARRRRTQGED